MNSTLADSIPELVTAIGCLILSAVFMTLYASYRVTQEAGLDRLEEKYPKHRELLSRFGRRWDTMRTSALLCGATSLLAAICLVIRALQPNLDWTGWPLWSSLAFLTVLLTIFANILPHALAESYADLFSMRFLPLAGAISRLLFPVAWPLARLERLLIRWLMAESDDDDRPSHEDEILYLVDQAPEAELEEEEREMIKSVFDFGETVAREVMTPRVDLVGLPANLTIAECSTRIGDAAHSRFPVYDASLDTISGYIHVKDMLRLLGEGKGQNAVSDSTKPILTVAESTPINDVLKLLRDEKEQIAVVFDEYGGTSGLLSMEDIVEELIGDIHDEYDTVQHVLQRLPDGSAVVDGRMSVYDVNEFLDLEIPEKEEYDSLAGYVFHTLGRIPRPGESVETTTFRLVIQSGSARRLHSILVQKNAIES